MNDELISICINLLKYRERSLHDPDDTFPARNGGTSYGNSFAEGEETSND